MRLKEGVFKVMTMTPNEFTKFLDSLRGAKVNVAFDQSTSCTGFVIDCIGEDFMIVGEIVKENLHADFFVEGLLNIIKDLLERVDARYVIIEEPLKYVTHRQNRVLVELKNSIINLLEDGDLNYEKFYKIAPQSWRAGLISKDNPYKKTSKEATVHEVLKLYPMLENFIPYVYNPTNNSGYDAFDAVGILVGFMNRFEVQEDSELVMNIGPKNTRSVALTMFVYSRPDDLQELSTMIELTKLMIGEQQSSPKVKIYNEECGVYLNAKMALTDSFTLMTITKQIDVVSTIMSFNLDYDPNKVLFMLVVPVSKVEKNIPQALKNQGYKIDVFY